LRLKNGDRVAIVSPNTPMFLEALFGIAGAGCVSLCINYKLTEKGSSLRVYRPDCRGLLDPKFCQSGCCAGG